MKPTIKKCLEQHLIDKAKGGTHVVPASVWLDSADKHIASASTVINTDPVGSLVLSWLAMHNIAKAAAASAGFELVDETHGKVADFLGCVFAGDLTDEEVGLIQTIRGGRNVTIYGDPSRPLAPLIGRAANLATNFRWNQYSPAGEVERIGAFARGAANRPSCRRAAFLTVALTLVLSVALLVVALLELV